MKHIILVFMSLLSVAWCNAQEKSDFQLDGLFYAFNGSEVTVVGQSKANRKLTEVTIPATVTYNSQTYTVTAVGYGAFWGNDSLVRLTIPDGVKTIRMEAFYSCRNLKRVTLSKTLEVIGENVFNGCVNLDSLVLPATIKQLNAGCLGHCSRLKNIYCLATESPEFVGYNHFTSFGKLHVIKGCKQAYLDNGRWEYWYEVEDDIELDGVESGNKDNNNTDNEPNRDDDSKNDNGSNKVDDSNKNNESSNGGDLNKDKELNQNTDSGNTETTGGSDSTDKTDSDKDAEKEKDQSTAIREIATTKKHTAFSLNGSRLNSSSKGINIINGKKVLVR